MNLRRQFADRGESLGLNGVAEASCEADWAQQAQLVLGESLMRLADGADHSALEVFASADEVQHLRGGRIEQQPVDGEIASLDVEASLGAKANLVGMTAVRISAVAAERRDFDGVIVPLAGAFVAHRNQYDAELAANRISLREQL